MAVSCRRSSAPRPFYQNASIGEAIHAHPSMVSITCEKRRRKSVAIASHVSCFSHLSVHFWELLFFRFRIGHLFVFRSFRLRVFFVDLHQLFLVFLRQRDCAILRARHRSKRSTHASIGKARSKIWRATGRTVEKHRRSGSILAEES